MKAVIMAGGKGSRIHSLYPDIPKPMIPVDGEPVLEREIELLSNQGIKEIIVTISHLGNVIKNYFKDGKKFDVNITYFEETLPLGNAGALFLIKESFEDDFLLINGDVIFDIDFNRIINAHKKNNALITLFTHPNNHPYDSGLIVADKNNRVVQWLTKEDTRPEFYKNRVNAGIHVISPEIFNLLEFDLKQLGYQIKIDLDRQVIKPLIKSGCIYCYDSPEYVRDMGTPERLLQVITDWKKGIIKNKNLKTKQKAVFLDRDGTINKYVGFLRDINEFELLPQVSEAIKKINQSGYLTIVVSNQPVIARGEVTLSELDMIHNKMETLLGNDGAYLDAIYYCPHHPDKGFKGEIPKYKIECSCRKPKPGMLLKAAKDFNIDLSASYMIGDSKNDITAGKAAGCKTILIGCNENYHQDLSFSSLYECISNLNL